MRKRKICQRECEIEREREREEQYLEFVARGKRRKGKKLSWMRPIVFRAIFKIFKKNFSRHFLSFYKIFSLSNKLGGWAGALV